MKDLKSFERFLSSIDLARYRRRYQPVKLVEMDLPPNIQAIAAIYDVYWKERRFAGFEGFYALYHKRHGADIEAFRKKITMCPDCFHRGLPARIYRTWASLITQIQAAYMAESVFGKGAVGMSAELDRKGADFQVKYKDRILNYQIKKETQSREVRKAKEVKKVIAGEFVHLFYKVPPAAVFENPKKKNGEYRKPYLDFIRNKDLRRLPNGFVIFTRRPFAEKKQAMDRSGE